MHVSRSSLDSTTIITECPIISLLLDAISQEIIFVLIIYRRFDFGIDWRYMRRGMF
jgi:hypothetical protein